MIRFSIDFILGFTTGFIISWVIFSLNTSGKIEDLYSEIRYLKHRLKQLGVELRDED